MASIYEMSVDSKGVTRYKMDKKFTKKANIPDATLEVLTTDNIVDENGLVIVEQKGDDSSDQEPDSANATDATDDNIDDVDLDDNGTTDDEQESADEAAARAAAEEEILAKQKAEQKPVQKRTRTRQFKSAVPQSKAGMGFPRANGKTGDIFDVNVPHTTIRQIGMHLVPLSAESDRTKSDEEIRARLEDLGYDVYDVSRYSDTSSDADVLDDDGDDLQDDTV
jgi:hypothetical protein